VVEGRSTDVVMLGFDGFRVLDARDVDGELESLVETTSEQDWCRSCGVRARSHSRPETLVRDVDAFARPVRLRWPKRRWRCREGACPAVTWTETSEAMRLSERDRSSYTEHLTRPGLVDTATGRLLDVVPERTAKAVTTWLAQCHPEWLAGIGVVALDPHRGYANAVATHLDHATLVVDHFHVIEVANKVIDDVRRRVQQDTTGHRGRAGDPLTASASCCSRPAATSTRAADTASLPACKPAIPRAP
jgi:transposase